MRKKNILDDFSMAFAQGQDTFFAFILNSWNIFERFLFEIFKQYTPEFEVYQYHMPDLVDRFEENDRPDIIMAKNNVPMIILDAKYKEEPETEDIRQVFDYLGRSNLRIGFLICPTESPNKNDVYKERSYQRVKMVLVTRYIGLRNLKEGRIREFVEQTIQLYKEQYHKLEPAIM